MIWDQYPDIYQQNESLDYRWTGTTSFPKVRHGEEHPDEAQEDRR